MSVLAPVPTLEPTSHTVPPTPPAASPATSPAAARATTGPNRSRARVTLARVARAEWIKFVTVRSNLLTLSGAAAATLGLGMLFSSLTGDDIGPEGMGSDAVSMAMGGLSLAQILLAILGVTFVASEYSTGLIRTMFGAVPRRLQVLAAKTGVVGGVTLVVMTVTAVVTFVASMAVSSNPDSVLTLTDDGVLRALAGTGIYAAAVAAMGVALGFLLRSTGSAIGVIIATLLVAPALVGLLPADLAEPISRILPSNAGAALRAVGDSGELLLTPAQGLGVLTAWVVGLLGAAAAVVRRRDA